MQTDTLRRRLLIGVGTPLALLLLLDGLICYLLSAHFASVVHDQWLVDSARSLAQAVRQEDGHAQFDLSRSAEEVFKFDEKDRTFFKVSSTRHGFIAGDRNLPDVAPGPGQPTRIVDTMYIGRPIRLVSTRISAGSDGDPWIISVAETVTKRVTLSQDILLSTAIPQVVLLGLAAYLSWTGLSRSLRPLTELSKEIETRDQGNLTPVSVDGLPKEAQILAMRINELLSRVSSVLGAQRRFVADAAHQLRTPLASLQLQTERIARATDLHTAQQANVALRKGVDRAAHLTHQLLTLARTEPESVASNAGFQRLDLAALAREVGEEWMPHALSLHSDFGLDVPDTSVNVLGDSQLLAAMIANLVDNALLYGGSPARVTLTVKQGASPILSVEDEGPGIAADIRDRVFERFYRAPDALGAGCGLGLAIVDEIVRMHGAAIRLSAGAGGRGTCFTVTFPPVADGSRAADAPRTGGV